MDHIFYQTKTYFSNTGDVLINRALIEELRQYGQLIANCSSDVPQDFVDALGIAPEERADYGGEISFVKAVISCAGKAKKKGDRVFIFSGPGDMYGGSPKLAFRNFASGMLFSLLRLMGVTIVRIGRSLGPISRWMAISEWVRGLFLSHCYVRDTRSLARCHKIGIKKAKLCPDLSWLYDQNHPHRTESTGTVMVNLRQSVFDRVEPDFIRATLDQCDAVLARLDQCMGHKMKVCVAYQIEEDEPFSRKIYDHLKKTYPTEYIDHRMALDELSDYYGRVDFHISNRMHSLLVGYKYGSLPIAVIDQETHTKISATLDDCGLSFLMIDIHDGDGAEKVPDLYGRRAEYLEELYACEAENQKKIREILAGVFSA